MAGQDGQFLKATGLNSKAFLLPFTRGGDYIIEMQDAELLREYATGGSDAAFAQLVDRYLDFVYSTARRQLANQQLAEEVSQAVFCLLVRKAAGLVNLTSLAGWLYRATCFISAKASRTEHRRRLRELEAATNMNPTETTDDGVWERLSPMLDDALNQLDEQERLAVLLRFFQKKPMREIGEALGVSEAAAKMRVGRAVERLREFFDKRGVAVGAGGLAALLVANAVQAAPAGMNLTISAGAALSSAALHHAGTTGIIKTLAMTTIQKTLMTAAIVAAVATGIYEASRATRLQHELRAFQEQQSMSAGQVPRLRQELDREANSLAALQQENEQLRRGTADLARLRGEITRLQAAARESAQLKPAATNNPAALAANSWLNRVKLLKDRLEQTPGAKIPELQFVTEQDWLNAARGELDTDADYRRALSTLRGAGEEKFAAMLKAALKQYMQGNNGNTPADLSLLQPYFESPVDAAVLDRWEVAPAQTIKSLGLGGDTVITQKTAVDDMYDRRFGIGPFGLGSTDFLSSETRDVMSAIYSAYRAANGDQSPDDLSLLTPYATTPEQQSALQKTIERDRLNNPSHGNQVAVGK